MNVSSEAYKLGQAQVEFQCLYGNKKDYKLRARGQYLKEGNNWKRYSHGQPIEKSKCIRVYIDEKRRS